MSCAKCGGEVIENGHIFAFPNGPSVEYHAECCPVVSRGYDCRVCVADIDARIHEVLQEREVQMTNVPGLGVIETVQGDPNRLRPHSVDLVTPDITVEAVA